MKCVFRIFKWGVFALVVAVVILALLLNSILKEVISRRIRTATGIGAEIKTFSFEVLTPTITFENFKLYNPPEFGGTPFLSIPELHIEYDRSALMKRELHITFMRLRLSELDVVKNQDGQTNLHSILTTLQIKQAGDGTKAFAQETRFEFKGIDMLNISIGKAKFIDLNDQHKNLTVDINLENQVIKNVKTPADLMGLATLIWLRGGGRVGLPVSQPSKSDLGTPKRTEINIVPGINMNTIPPPKPAVAGGSARAPGTN